MVKTYHKATSSEFPLGTIIFYCDIGSYNTLAEGITHVGIVVGNKDDSPQIAHAAIGNGIEHVVVSRLQECKGGLGYIKVVLPDTFNKELIVALATALATASKEEEPIIKYSEARCNAMEKKLRDTFYNLKHKEQRYSRTISDNIKSSAEDFVYGKRNAGWYTMLAKAFNIIRSDIVGDIKNKMGKSYKATYINEMKKNFRDKYSKYLFTNKGYHCVQFVVAILQISFLLTNKVVRGFVSEDVKIERNYFSRKKSGVFQGGFRAIHPAEVIHDGMKSSLKKFFVANSLPVDGKSLSPAGLLHLFVPEGDGPQGRSRPLEGAIVTSSFGILSLSQCKQAISNIKQQVTQDSSSYAATDRGSIRRINAMVEIFAVKKALENIFINQFRVYIARHAMPLLSNSLVPQTSRRRVRRDNDNSSEENEYRAKRSR
ncbi:MAG: hypothetical protein HON55_02740 [Legionellales bacterium]|nr:hypothetical protein [Legionellales bacterium]